MSRVRLMCIACSSYELFIHRENNTTSCDMHFIRCDNCGQIWNIKGFYNMSQKIGREENI
jgi:uncharacterized Zn finger protein